VVRVPYPDPYHPVLDTDGSSATLLRYLDHLIDDPYSGIDEVSSVLVEPILGEGGYVIPPDDFLPGLREFCDRHDLLLIVDEVQTGLGRTGKRWAVDHAGVTPDLVCVGKSIGGGIPLSLVAYREDLRPELPSGFHLGTYRANPLALAAGTEVLRELDEGGWIARAAHRGDRLLREFRELAAPDATVGEVRGRGFMIGLEFVRDRGSRRPFGDRARLLRHELLARGVLMHSCGPHDQVLRFMAPLTIEEKLLERGLDLFREALHAGPGPSGPGPMVGHPRPSLSEHRLGPAADAFPPVEPIRPGLPF
jgi:4-aminobutyrate aminotransferase-like enzyme